MSAYVMRAVAESILILCSDHDSRVRVVLLKYGTTTQPQRRTNSVHYLVKPVCDTSNQLEIRITGELDYSWYVNCNSNWGPRPNGPICKMRGNKSQGTKTWQAGRPGAHGRNIMTTANTAWNSILYFWVSFNANIMHEQINNVDHKAHLRSYHECTLLCICTCS